MKIETQEELFKGPVKIKHITEKGIKVSKIFFGEKIKVIFYGEVIRKGDIVEISGKIFVDHLTECARCLDEFNLNVSEEIKIYLKPSYMLPKEDEIELKVEDLDDDFYEQDEIDFYEYILNLGRSVIPPYNFCSENCKGICSKCGANLNRENCSCKTAQEKESGVFDILLKKEQKN